MIGLKGKALCFKETDRLRSIPNVLLYPFLLLLCRANTIANVCWCHLLLCLRGWHYKTVAQDTPNQNQALIVLGTVYEANHSVKRLQFK